MRPIQSTLPILGFAAYSGTGKTTLLSTIIPLLKNQGLRIGMIKHAHHAFDIDHPGKDSYRLRKAGTDQMLIVSSRRWALMVETQTNTQDPSLQMMVDRLDTSNLDIILVEGFKHETFPKIELHRPELGHDVMYLADENIIAIASNTTINRQRNITLLDIDNPTQVADFIVNFINQVRHPQKQP